MDILGLWMSILVYYHIKIIIITILLYYHIKISLNYNIIIIRQDISREKGTQFNSK